MPEPAITTEPEPETIPLEPEPEVSPDTLIQIIDFLDEVIAIHPDNAENIEDMRAILEDMLLEIENDYSTE